ncbi:MAG: sigma-E processing peptidase SpoIIGA [Clostridia bacterium]|nr:sigma-E processing peptidase SpoIIGA [Clostridia bacterium]
MTTVIYADSLLALNFSMDFLALFLSGKVLRSKIRPGRLSLAAGLGALYSLLAVFLSETSMGGRITSTCAWAACTPAMAAIAYGGSLPVIAKTTLLFGGVSLALGGTMTALYSLLGRLGGVPSADAGSPLTFALIVLISGGVSLLWNRARRESVREVSVCISVGGETVTLRCLVDSGNLLIEPISGKPVIIVPPGRFGEPEPRRLRLIPATGVTGSRMLTGFLPDGVTLDGRAVDAVIAVDREAEDFGGCEGIVPEILIL